MLFNCLQEEIVVLIFTVAADLWSVFGRNLQYGFSLATHVGSYLRPVKEVERLDSLLVWSTSALRVRQGTLMDPSCRVSGTSATQILCLSHQNPNMSPLEGSHGDRLPASDAVSEDYPRWPQAQLRLVEASVIDGCSAPPPPPPQGSRLLADYIWSATEAWVHLSPLNTQGSKDEGALGGEEDELKS